MKIATLEKSTLKGSIEIPPSKSHTLRAILFGFLGDGKTHIYRPLSSPDTQAMIEACLLLGGRITVQKDHIEIIGNKGNISFAQDVIHAGNSGQVLRFVGAIAALSSYPIILTGDHSIRHNRPVFPLLDALSQLGVEAVSTKGDGYAPILIKGPMRPGKAIMSGEDSQPVSGMLIASAFAKGPIEIFVLNPGEKPWVNLTLSWFDRLGISYQRSGHDYFRLEGNTHYKGFQYEVPGDFSSCAFPIAAALLTNSEITLKGLDMEDAQGDKKVIDVFVRMGAHIEVDREKKSICVRRSKKLSGIEVDVNDFIDATPILAVMGCFSEGITKIKGAKIARKKECDRLSCITLELKKMGAKIEEEEEGLTIYPSTLKGARVESHADHRMAMALSVAGLSIEGKTEVQGVSCIEKSYPEFFQHMQNLGASIRCG